MSTTINCDRCQEEVEYPAIIIAKGDYEWDLCHLCYKLLQEWMGYT